MNFSEKLSSLMQRVGIANFQALSRVASVSKHQILLLRQGKAGTMRVDMLAKLSQVLQVSLDELIRNFSQVELEDEINLAPKEELKAEYSRLLLQLENQRQQLQQEFQQSTLHVLESLLIQFPTAAHKAQENPQLPAVNIVPLVQKPLDRLLQEWGIEAIASVGVELDYDPQLHQLLEGNAQPGEKVKIRYKGYRQGDKLLYRAKVSRV